MMLDPRGLWIWWSEPGTTLLCVREPEPPSVRNGWWCLITGFLVSEGQVIEWLWCMLLYMLGVRENFWVMFNCHEDRMHQKVFFVFFLLLFNYSCVPFLPIPPPHPSWTHLPPPSQWKVLLMGKDVRYFLDYRRTFPASFGRKMGVCLTVRM